MRTEVNPQNTCETTSCGGMCFVTPVPGKVETGGFGGGLCLDIQICLLRALQAGEEAQRGSIENDAWIVLWPLHTLLHTCASHTQTHREILNVHEISGGLGHSYSIIGGL